MLVSKKILILVVLLMLGCGTKDVLAQDNPSALRVPLIGITSVPEPLALPEGPGNVAYNYAVKHFTEGVGLTDIHVVDDKCGPVTFVEGDDDGDSQLDYSETWRYVCTIRVSGTTQSVATVTGTTNNTMATHKAFTTVVVGSDLPPPLVSIVNVTKVASPLSLPPEGGEVTFTYRVSNPGVVPLSNVVVTDDKCSAISSRLGDKNYNNLLDINEVWIYTCEVVLRETTINTVRVVAFANGLEAVGSATIAVEVENPAPDFHDQEVPGLPDTGADKSKVVVWSTLFGILVGLAIFLVLTRKGSAPIQKQ